MTYTILLYKRLVVIFIDADEARRAIEQAIKSYSDQRELPSFTRYLYQVIANYIY